MKRSPLPFLVAAVLLGGCNSTDPSEAFDLEVTVECSGCPTIPHGDNLRLSLFPESAVTGDTIQAWDIKRATNHAVLSTTTVTAFTDIARGRYVVSAAALASECSVSTGAIAYPAGHYPNEPPYIWPILQVAVPLSAQARPTVRLDCQ